MPVDTRRGPSGRAPQSRPRSLIALAVLAISFGFIEGAVVVYLREILYPEGFRFPLVPISDRLLRVELVRELATLLLLLGAAWLAASQPLRRFAAFAFAFGVWDLVYYVTLALVLGWPTSILDWDILFLLPIPWVGPVLSPALVALALVIVGWALFLLPPERLPRLAALDWWIESAAGIVILIAFMWNGPAIIRQETPATFPWLIFLIGYLGGWVWLIYRWLFAPRDSRERRGVTNRN